MVVASIIFFLLNPHIGMRHKGLELGMTKILAPVDIRG